MKVLKVDYENNGEEFWSALQEREWAVYPDGLKRFANGQDSEVLLADDEATHFLALCESLPGWNDGPEYAPHPLIFTQVSP